MSSAATRKSGLSGRDDKEAEGEGDEALLYFSKNSPKMINDPSDYCSSKQPTPFRPLDDSWTRGPSRLIVCWKIRAIHTRMQ